MRRKSRYFNVLRAVRNLDVKRETLRQRESLLKQAQAYFEAGIRAKIDVARAEANLYDARAQVSQAENDVRVARITLLNRMGVEGPADFLLSDSLAAETIPGTLPDWIAEAEQEPAGAQVVPGTRARRRPGSPVRAGGASSHARRHRGVRVRRRRGAPRPGLQRRRDAQRPPLLGVPDPGAGEGGGGVALLRPVSADRTRGGCVILQVEQAAYGVSEASERIEARKKEREASAENLRLATARYEVGAGDIIEMIDAQVQMTQADTATIDAQYDYSVSVATLLRAVGR